MASYTDTKIKAVEEIIDKFTQDTLDTYVRKKRSKVQNERKGICY